MEIPLTLTKNRIGKLIYSIPIWYRILMSIMLITIILSLIISEQTIFFGWIIFVIVLIGLIYFERWSFDSNKNIITYTRGFYPFLRNTILHFEDLEDIRIEYIIKSAVPGTKEERDSIERISNPQKDTASYDQKSKNKKVFALLRLIIDSKDGQKYLLDTTNGRRAVKIKQIAETIGNYCGIQVK